MKSETNAGKDSTSTPPDLEKVFVRICDHGPVTRGDRLSWFIQHLNRTIRLSEDSVTTDEREKLNESDERIPVNEELLSNSNSPRDTIFIATHLLVQKRFLNSKTPILESPTNGDDRRIPTLQGRLTNETEVIFYATTYNLVIYLDMNLSTMSVQSSDGNVINETLRTGLKRALYDSLHYEISCECDCHFRKVPLRRLVNLSIIADSRASFDRETIKTHNQGNRFMHSRALCHRVSLDVTCLDSFWYFLEKQLDLFENEVVKNHSLWKQMSSNSESFPRKTTDVREERSSSNDFTSNYSFLEEVVQNSITIMRSLPSSDLPIILLITDRIPDRDIASYYQGDSLRVLNQDDVRLVIFKVNSNGNTRRAWGYHRTHSDPFTDVWLSPSLMIFLTNVDMNHFHSSSYSLPSFYDHSTMAVGVLFDSLRISCSSSQSKVLSTSMSKPSFHRNLEACFASKSLARSRNLLGQKYDQSTDEQRKESHGVQETMITFKYKEYLLLTDMMQLLFARFREGFCIKRLNFCEKPFPLWDIYVEFQSIPGIMITYRLTTIELDEVSQDRLKSSSKPQNINGFRVEIYVQCWRHLSRLVLEYLKREKKPDKTSSTHATSFLNTRQDLILGSLTSFLHQIQDTDRILTALMQFQSKLKHPFPQEKLKSTYKSDKSNEGTTMKSLLYSNAPPVHDEVISDDMAPVSTSSNLKSPTGSLHDVAPQVNSQNSLKSHQPFWSQILKLFISNRSNRYFDCFTMEAMCTNLVNFESLAKPQFPHLPGILKTCLDRMNCILLEQDTGICLIREPFNQSIDDKINPVTGFVCVSLLGDKGSPVVLCFGFFKCSPLQRGGFLSNFSKNFTECSLDYEVAVTVFRDLQSRFFLPIEWFSMKPHDHVRFASPESNLQESFHSLNHDLRTSFLRHHHSIWFTSPGLDFYGDDLFGDATNFNMINHRLLLIGLAFERLVARRIEEGFVLLNWTTDTCLFIKGFRALQRSDESICWIQYVLHRDDENCLLFSEIWGPSFLTIATAGDTSSNLSKYSWRLLFDQIGREILETDCQVIRPLYTYVLLHQLASASMLSRDQGTFSHPDNGSDSPKPPPICSLPLTANNEKFPILFSTSLSSHQLPYEGLTCEIREEYSFLSDNRTMPTDNLSLFSLSSLLETSFLAGREYRVPLSNTQDPKACRETLTAICTHFSESLKSLSDYEILETSSGLNSQFLSKLCDDLLLIAHDSTKLQSIVDGDSTPSALGVRSIFPGKTSYRSFLKCFSNDTFLVIIVPVPRVETSNTNYDSSRTSFLHSDASSFVIVLAECRRPPLWSGEKSFSLVLANRIIRAQQTDISSKTLSIERNRVSMVETGFLGHVIFDSFDKHHRSLFFSLENRQFLMNMDRAVQRAALRVVYQSLLKGISYSSDEMDNLLELCTEIILDFDVTLLVVLADLLQRLPCPGMTNNEVATILELDYNRLFNEYFSSLDNSHSKSSPDSTAFTIAPSKIYRVFSPSGSISSLTATSIEPLFVKFEGVFRRSVRETGDVHASFANIPMSNVPHSLRIINEQGLLVDFMPDSLSSIPLQTILKSSEWDLGTLKVHFRIVCLKPPSSTHETAFHQFSYSEYVNMFEQPDDDEAEWQGNSLLEDNMRPTSRRSSVSSISSASSTSPRSSLSSCSSSTSPSQSPLEFLPVAERKIMERFKARLEHLIIAHTFCLKVQGNYKDLSGLLSDFTNSLGMYLTPSHSDQSNPTGIDSRSDRSQDLDTCSWSNIPFWNSSSMFRCYLDFPLVASSFDLHHFERIVIKLGIDPFFLEPIDRGYDSTPNPSDFGRLLFSLRSKTPALLTIEEDISRFAEAASFFNCIRVVFPSSKEHVTDDSEALFFHHDDLFDHFAFTPKNRELCLSTIRHVVSCASKHFFFAWIAQSYALDNETLSWRIALDICCPTFEPQERRVCLAFLVSKLAFCVKRWNQESLLTSLYLTHQWSPWLKPEVGENFVDELATPSDFEENEETRGFLPSAKGLGRGVSSDDLKATGSSDITLSFRTRTGQLACPCVLYQSFKLYERLDAIEAARFFNDDVLQSFSLTNRKNTYVFRLKEGSVVYLELRSKPVARNPRHLHERRRSLSLDSVTSRSLYPSSTTLMGSRATNDYYISADSNQLELYVYALDPIDPVFSREIVDMIQARLKVLATETLSTALYRRQIHKLQHFDLERIFPSSSPSWRGFSATPLSPATFLTTHELFTWWQYFRQSCNLFSESINVTDEAELEAYLCFETLKGDSFDAPWVYSSINDFFTPSDRVLLHYSVASRHHNPIEFAFGKGMVGLRFTWIEAESIGESHDYGSYSSQIISALHEHRFSSGISMDSECIKASSSFYGLQIDMFSSSEMNFSGLFESICAAMRHSACDFAFDLLLEDFSLATTKPVRNSNMSGLQTSQLLELALSRQFEMLSRREESLLSTWSVFELPFHGYSWQKPAIDTRLTQFLREIYACESIPLNILVKSYFSSQHLMKPLEDSTSNVVVPALFSCSSFPALVATNASPQNSSLQDNQLLHNLLQCSLNVKRRSSHATRSFRMLDSIHATIRSTPSRDLDSRSVPDDAVTHRPTAASVIINSQSIVLLTYNIDRNSLEALRSHFMITLKDQQTQARHIESAFYQKLGLFYRPVAPVSSVNATLIDLLLSLEDTLHLDHKEADDAKILETQRSRVKTVTALMIEEHEAKQSRHMSSFKNSWSSLVFAQVLYDWYPGLIKNAVGSVVLGEHPVLDLIDLVWRASKESRVVTQLFDEFQRAFVNWGQQSCSLSTVSSTGADSTTNHSSLSVHEGTNSSCDKLAKEFTSNSIIPGELELLLRSSRILHSCRTPLLFTQLRDSLFMPSGESFICTSVDFLKDNPWRKSSDIILSEFSKSDQDQDTTLSIFSAYYAWLHSRLECLMEEYAAYLISLGLSLVLVDEASLKNESRDINTQQLRPEYVVTETFRIATSRWYLQKGFETGVLLVEMGIEGLFFNVNLYSMSTSKRATFLQTVPVRNFNRSSHWRFAESCANFKNFLHVNSVVYDFHLRSFLDMFSKSQESVAAGSFDVLDMVRACSIYNSFSPVYAKSRLSRQELVITLDVPSNDFYQYLVIHACRYGYRSLKHRHIPAALTTTLTSDLSSSLQESSQTKNINWPFVTALMVFPTTMDPQYSIPIEKSTSTLKLWFYLLLVNVEQPFPTLTREQVPRDDLERMLQRNLHDQPAEMLFSNAYDACLPNLARYVNSAKAHIENLFHCAKQDYHFDALWKNWWSAEIRPSLTLDDLEQVMNEERCRRIDLRSLDARLYDLISHSHISWRLMLENFALTSIVSIYYPKTLAPNQEPTYAFCLLMEEVYRDAFVVLRFNLVSDTLESCELIERCLDELDSSCFSKESEIESQANRLVCVSTILNRLLQMIFWNCRRLSLLVGGDFS